MDKVPTLVKVIMLKGEKGDTGNATWGGIGGNIANQTDLNNLFNDLQDDMLSVSVTGETLIIS